METSTTHTSWHVERLIAFFLFLLFFLPFVASGEEILLTGTFHEDEVRQRSSDDWLALTATGNGWMLQPVRVSIEKAVDPMVDEEGAAMTGRQVTAMPVDEPLLLVRGQRVSPGVVTAAVPDTADLRLQSTSALRFGTSTYQLRFRCGGAKDDSGDVRCSLDLELGDTIQTLAYYSAMRDEQQTLTFTGEVTPTVIWAGDLDRDGQLDLLLDTSDHYNQYAPTLYLSSAARKGQLMARVALFRSTGC